MGARKLTPAKTISRRAEAAPRQRRDILVLAACAPERGGLEAMSLRVTHELHRRGHRLILAHTHDGDAAELYRPYVRDMVRIDLAPLGLRRPWIAAGMMRRLAALVRRERVAACFSTNFGLIRTTFALRQLTGVPTLYHVGGCPLPRRDWLTDFCLHHIARAIAPSDPVAEALAKAGLPANRIAVAANWVDGTVFRPIDAGRQEARRALGLPMAGPLVLFVGRVEHDKGPHVLLRAAARLRECEFSLALIGSTDPKAEPEIARLCAIIETGSARVRRVGQTTQPERYLALADIVVVPSVITEGFGLAVIEGMASEAVTLVSRIRPLPELIGKANDDMAFAGGDDADLARVLGYWLAVPASARRARGTALRERVLALYSPANAAAYARALDFNNDDWL